MLRTSLVPAVLVPAVLSLSLFAAPGWTADVSPGDRVFLQSASAAGMFEVHASELALERSTRPTVKAFAKMMVEDHSRANAKLRTLANSRQIDVPTTLDADHAQKLAKLKSHPQGPAFDEAYADAMEDGHDAALRLFKAAADGADDPVIRAFATDTLRTLATHNEHAEALDGEQLAH